MERHHGIESTPEFRAEVVRIAQTSSLKRREVVSREHFCHSVDDLPLPGAALVRVQFMLRFDLLDGLVSPQRIFRHLGFKLICKVPALCQFRIPSKAWDTPSPTVPISGITSWLFERSTDATKKAASVVTH